MSGISRMVGLKKVRGNSRRERELRKLMAGGENTHKLTSVNFLRPEIVHHRLPEGNLGI